MKKLLLITVVALLVAGMSGVAFAELYDWTGSGTTWQDFGITWDSDDGVVGGDWGGEDPHGGTISGTGTDLGDGWAGLVGTWTETGGGWSGTFCGFFKYADDGDTCYGSTYSWDDPPGNGIFGGNREPY